MGQVQDTAHIVQRAVYRSRRNAHAVSVARCVRQYTCQHRAFGGIRVKQAERLVPCGFGGDVARDHDAVDIAFDQLAPGFGGVTGHIERQTVSLSIKERMCHPAERIMCAETEHISKRCGVMLLHSGGAKRFKQRCRRFRADAMRQTAHRAGKRRMIKGKRVGTLRAPAVSRGTGIRDVRHGISSDTLYGCGKNMVGGKRGHNSSPSANSFSAMPRCMRHGLDKTLSIVYRKRL